jgi:hypothetical protein
MVNSGRRCDGGPWSGPRGRVNPSDTKEKTEVQDVQRREEEDHEDGGHSCGGQRKRLFVARDSGAGDLKRFVRTLKTEEMSATEGTDDSGWEDSNFSCVFQDWKGHGVGTTRNSGKVVSR